MMTLKVLTQEGKETQATVRLNKTVFGIEPNQHAIYLDVKAILANKRQGTHQTKERGEIVGSTRKLRKQKGTGAARVGSIKNPIFRKGGRTFGPRPRSYEQKINKQLKKLARRSALSQKAQNKKLKVVDKFEFEQPKTKELTQSLHDLGLDQTKTLVVLSEQNKNAYLASRNLQKAKVVVNTELNTYDISAAKCIVLERQAIKKIETALKS